MLNWLYSVAACMGPGVRGESEVCLMSKMFNITGDCKPGLHYMVDIEGRLREIKILVDKGEYFVINRARQYGKTTTLRALKIFLQNEYLVVSLDFQKQMSAAKFRNENAFSQAFAKAFLKGLLGEDIALGTGESGLREADFREADFREAAKALRQAVEEDTGRLELVELFEYLCGICAASPKPVVLMVDEVDSAADNQVFLDFLAQLRGYYIDRDVTPTFQSVILAGVYDIRNLRRKIHPEDEHKRNSPWNIASEFTVDMSFSAADIAGMLAEYEEDTRTGMDIIDMASLIFEYTSGYPFLVSCLCKIIDEKIAGSDRYPSKSDAWTKLGFLDAVKILLTENNTLFDSLINKLHDFPELRDMIYSLLFTGRNFVYNPDHYAVSVAVMFGFVKISSGMVVIANRIFETRLYNMFLSDSTVLSSDMYKASLQDRNQFIEKGHLNMSLVLQKFVTHFHDLYGDRDNSFLEEDGRRYFLLYLRPIINGTGNYYIESRTRDLRRTDVIVDYHGEQYIIELKIWHGEEYDKRGQQQLAGYLDDYHQKKGYLLSFNFNKNKQIGIREITVGDKLIVEAVV